MCIRKRTGSPCARPGALLALLVALAPGRAAAAGVEFYATPDREEVALDETLTLTVTLGLDANSGESEDLRLPEAPDFDVLSRSQSQQMSFAMGSGGPPTFRKVRVFTLLLQPRRTGSFTIKPGRLVFRGKTYETGALRIKVLSAGSGRPPATAPPSAPPPRRAPPNPFGGLGDVFGDDDPDAQDLLNQFFGNSRPTSDTDLYVRAYVDKKQAYLGEQMTFSAFLFTRVDVSGVDGLKQPKLDGFWAEDLETPQQLSGELKMIDGVPYRVFLLRKRALFPIKLGKLTIDPVEADVSTGFGLQLRGGKVHRSSQPIAVEILPLPAGAPDGFANSNVGQWRLSAEATPTTTPLGQPVTLKVTLEGTGNLHDVALGKLPPIAGFKSYEPTVTEKVSTSKGRFGGRRVLEYLLMPVQTGSFELPALTLHYYDPAAREYRTATTQAIPVRVEPGAGGVTSQGSASAAGPNGPSQVNLLAGGLRPLRYKGELVRPRPPLYRRAFFVPIALAPLALGVLVLVMGLARSTLRPTAAGLQRGQASRARRRLRAAHGFLKAGKPDEFYGELSRALDDYLAARLGGPVTGLTRTDLAKRLAEAGLKPELCARVSAALDRCDAGRFAPGGASPESMERLLREAQLVMEALEGARLAAPVAVEATP